MSQTSEKKQDMPNTQFAQYVPILKSLDYELLEHYRYPDAYFIKTAESGQCFKIDDEFVY